MVGESLGPPLAFQQPRLLRVKQTAHLLDRRWCLVLEGIWAPGMKNEVGGLPSNVQEMYYMKI